VFSYSVLKGVSPLNTGTWATPKVGNIASVIVIENPLAMPSTTAYQWQRCKNDVLLGLVCNDVAGRTTLSYGIIANGDKTFMLRVKLTGTNADGSTTVFSDLSGAVA
jgi:hypothetical protein